MFSDRDYPVVGVLFLSLFGLSLFIQKESPAASTLAFLATADDPLVAYARQRYFDAK